MGGFIGMEFGVYDGGKLLRMRVPQNMYHHFAYDPEKRLFGCYDTFGKIVFAVPAEFCVYVKNYEEGFW